MADHQTQPTSRNDAPVEPPRSKGVSLAAIIWTGVAVVVLSFVASFLGASLARSADAAEPVESSTPTPSETVDYEAVLAEILPAGSAVRAGTGVPEAGKGYEGDVYIDVATSDVYVFRDGEWTLTGNIRQSAAENLTGETGATGDAGAAGASGAPGEPGAAGTQLSLGVGAPEEEKCEADGDVYIDTSALQFYECTEGEWTPFGSPASSPSPAP